MKLLKKKKQPNDLQHIQENLKTYIKFCERFGQPPSGSLAKEFPVELYLKHTVGYKVPAKALITYQEEPRPGFDASYKISVENLSGESWRINGCYLRVLDREYRGEFQEVHLRNTDIIRVELNVRDFTKVGDED